MRRLVWAGGAVAACAYACSSGGSNNGFNDVNGHGQGDDGGILGGDDGGGFGDDGGGNQNGCSGQAKDYVYVLSKDNDLYSFAPDKKQFGKVGHLGCNTTMQPNSMAIDRSATAWVNYVQNDGLSGDTAGSLFKVSTKDASCQDPSFSMPSGFYRVGMGFSTDSSSGTSETLFIAGTAPTQGGSAQGLAKVDLGAKSVKPIANFSGSLSGKSAELTGTGDARLFGFFTTTPVQVAEVDKSSAAIKSSKQLAQVETPAAWAFSFWGGKFYLYTSPDPTLNPTRTSNVSEYDPTGGSVNPQYMTNIGFIIVGAGVSTCAPTVPPK